jgi:NAD-dependent dihydropyrimidine dehydrogenase PreA subunit
MNDLTDSGEVIRRRTNPEKVRRASLDPARPGLDCKADPGSWMPVVNRAACEGKRDCVEVCPYDVFEVRRIDASDFSPLSFIDKLKSRVHGMQTAYTPRADACQACGLCVVACPEGAIELVPR